MNAWEILWQQRETFYEGFGNTLMLFACGTVGAFILGIIAIFALENDERAPLRRLLMWSIDIMRMLPFLIYAYLLYYGLPKVGIRMDAWTAGLIALVTYHGAYFAEILRGLRATLPRGQVEAGLAHGYSKKGLMFYLVLPQLLLKGGPLFGNQLIYLLKDTAFLTIITVKELTWAASSIQATYFIPVQAFVVAIVLYWAVSLLIARCMRGVEKVAITRGLGNE